MEGSGARVWDGRGQATQGSDLLRDLATVGSDFEPLRELLRDLATEIFDLLRRTSSDSKSCQ